MAKTGRDSVQQMLRLPDDLRDRIKASAETNNRSLNAEIVSVLEQVYPPPPPAFGEDRDEFVAMLERVNRRIEAGDASEEASVLKRQIEDVIRAYDELGEAERSREQRQAKVAFVIRKDRTED